MSSRRLGDVALLFALAATVTTFLPWAVSGATARSSYELVGATRRLGLLGGFGAVLALSWILVPVLGIAAAGARAGGRKALATMSAAAGGGLVSTGAALTIRSPLLPEPACWVGLVLGTAAGLAGLAGLAALAGPAALSRTRPGRAWDFRSIGAALPDADVP